MGSDQLDLRPRGTRAGGRTRFAGVIRARHRDGYSAVGGGEPNVSSGLCARRSAVTELARQVVEKGKPFLVVVN